MHVGNIVVVVVVGKLNVTVALNPESTPLLLLINNSVCCSEYVRLDGKNQPVRRIFWIPKQVPRYPKRRSPEDRLKLEKESVNVTCWAGQMHTWLLPYVAL